MVFAESFGILNMVLEMWFAIPLGFLFCYLGLCVYNVWFHPLRNIPGPLFARASILYSTYWHFTGWYCQHMSVLQEKYGPVVRIAPNELVYTNSQAWKELYGVQQDRTHFEKDPTAWGWNRRPMLVGALDADNKRLRRPMAKFFSDKYLYDIEPRVQSYVTLLMERLHDTTSLNAIVDIAKWLNMLTFDIMGDLIFSESFNCLESGKEHPSIHLLHIVMKFLDYSRLIRRFPHWSHKALLLVLASFAPPAFFQKKSLIREKTERRVAKGITEHNDILNLGLVETKKSTSDIKPWELRESCLDFLIGGSDTTASFLKAAIYYSCKNFAATEKLIKELQNSFSGEGDITFFSTQKLVYLDAFVQEVLRIYAPSPDSLPRIVHKPGYWIHGTFVPAGTIVGVHPYAAFRSSRNFHRPNEFIPERWLGDPEFANDDRDVVQAFHVGPRVCVGQNLAWFEMRLFVARLLWNFKFELVEEKYADNPWEQHKAQIFWDRPALWVKLTSRDW